MAKRSVCLLILAVALSSFTPIATLKGLWEFQGGIYNGKREGAPTTYSLQRKYNAKHFKAYFIEKGSHKKKYEAGDYVLKGDTCTETQTYTSEPSQLTNIKINYQYQLRNDTLILKARLPSGMNVEEYWKKIK